MNYYAHIDIENGSERVQTVEEHNRNTAVYAASALAGSGLSSSAHLAGLVHDIGKATAAFQDYLAKAVRGENVARGSVNHTFAAVRFLLTRYNDAQVFGPYAPLTVSLLAYAVGAHHGPFDCVDAEHHSGFRHRLEQEGISYAEAETAFRSTCGTEETDRLFCAATKEVEDFFKRFLQAVNTRTTAQEFMFYAGMLARLLLSAVIEGDRRDTAEFMKKAQFPQAQTADARAALWGRLSERVDAALDAMPQDTAIRRARRTISMQCRTFADQPCGVYRLHVPTGGGKTLSALRFALAHAAKWKKTRLIFLSPLLSILDQNAKEIRKYVGEDDLILEHHSNVVRPPADKKDERTDITELLTETWDAPILITTLVQFLNTLFDGSNSCVRRFHSLCGSVIVIDEVQTVPNKLLSLFHLAVGFLAGACGATVVLCSATQPCMEAAAHPIPVPVGNMIPYDAALWSVFRRTQITDVGSRPLADIPDLFAEVLTEADSLLVICNTKKEAESLYGALPKDAYIRFHLSAAMCMAHRENTLDCLKAALEKTRKQPYTGKKVVCISTQVIEAGVDISFARVIRLTAGMDSVVQSAGRCNRNGESREAVPVYIVQCTDENLKHLNEIKQAKDATIGLLEEYRQHPARFDGDLSSDAAIRYYYKRLYEAMPIGAQDTPADVFGKRTTLLSLLSDNDKFADSSMDRSFEKYGLWQAFKTAGQYFSVFDSATTDILVPHGKGKDLIASLTSLQLPQDFERLRALQQEAKAYSVSIYGWQKERLEQENALIPLCGGTVLALQVGYYNDAVGLRTEQGTMELWGV